MPASIPESRRVAAVDDYLRKKAAEPTTSYAVVAKEHGIGEASLKRWVALRRADGAVTTKRKRGRPPRLDDPLRQAAVDLVLAEPTLRLYEVAARIGEVAGFTVSEDTVRRALRARGIGKRRLVRE